MERLVNFVRNFIDDDKINCRMKCLVIVTVASLTIAPIAVLTTVLENNHFVSMVALYVMIFDIAAICVVLVFWLGYFVHQQNNVAAPSHQETVGTYVQHPSNTNNLEHQPVDSYAPVGIELCNLALSSNRCGLSPTTECITSNDTPFNYENVSIPATRPNIPPKINNRGETYTLYSLEGGQETFIGAEALLNSDHSQFCSRVPLKCCFESDKACANAKNEPNSGETIRGQLSPGSRKQNDFRSSSILTNQSRQITVPGRRIQPLSKDVSSYCGTRRTLDLPKERLRTLPMKQVKILDVADERPSTTTREEDLKPNCNPKRKSRTLLRHSKTLPPSRQDINSTVAQKTPFWTINESNNYESGQNPSILRRKRYTSAPSSRSKAFEDAEGKSCFTTNENFLCNSDHIQPRVGSPKNNIVIPPSPSNSRPRLLHGLLSAILTSNIDEPLTDFVSSESVDSQPRVSGPNPLDNDWVRTFPTVSYEEISSSNYLVHVSMTFSKEEIQNFLSKRGQF